MRGGFFIITLLLYLCGNVYVFVRLWQAFPWRGPVAKAIFSGAAFLLASTFLAAFRLRGILPEWLMGGLYGTGSNWLIIFLYLLMLLLLRDLVVLADRFFRFLPPAVGQVAVKPFLTYAAVGVTAVLLICGNIHYFRKERVELNITTEKPLPPGGLKIVFLSDLHLGYATGNREIEHWVELANREQPDLILIAGDIVDNNTRPLTAHRMDRTLRQLHAPEGVYACPGNHEHIGGKRNSEQFIRSAGICLLVDSVATPGAFLNIVGRNDRSARRRKNLEELTDSLDTEKFTVLLDHQPYDLAETARYPVDLQLSGHTHRGQIWPFTRVTDRLFEVSHGYARKGNTDFYITSGIGIWGGKFRIGSRSEYVVINLTHSAHL
ncbi:MAG: metallophosphoesterase [Culturomica sp.]|jgi:predicted MPP superfamily phosphohydrolase|nr:metallophosphoesterase [Culturomica sp.]